MHARNVVVLVGRLVADPVLRYTNGGSAVTEFSLAVNRSIRKNDGSFEDALDGFFDCELWGAVGEVVAEKFTKGSELYVTGSLAQNKFEKDGRKISRILVKVKTVGPALSAPRKTDQAADAAAQQPAPEQEKVPQPV